MIDGDDEDGAANLRWIGLRMLRPCSSHRMRTDVTRSRYDAVPYSSTGTVPEI